MDIVKAVIIGAIILVFLFLLLKVYFDEHKTFKYKNRTKFMVRVGIFGAISAILYAVPALHFPVPFLPPFLEFHFDEIPMFIASFAYGPLAGFLVLIIKTVIKLPLTTSLCVGELTDLLCSLAFIIPAALLYNKKRCFKNAIVGLIIGTICQLVVSLLCNIFISIPFYLNVMEISESALLSMMQKATPLIKDIKWTYGLFAVLPFNVIKDAAVIIVTILVYKSLHKFIDNLQN